MTLNPLPFISFHFISFHSPASLSLTPKDILSTLMEILLRGNEENALKALDMVKKMKALARSSGQQQFQVYDKDFQKVFYNFCCTMHERVPAAVAVTFPHSVIPVRVTSATSVGGTDYKENQILSSVTIGGPNPAAPRSRSQSPPTAGVAASGVGAGAAAAGDGEVSAEPPAKRRRRSGSTKTTPQDKLRARYERQVVSEGLKVMSPGPLRRSWGSFALLKVGGGGMRLFST